MAGTNVGGPNFSLFITVTYTHLLTTLRQGVIFLRCQCEERRYI